MISDLVNDELVGIGEALFCLSPELFLVLGESRPKSTQRVRRSDQHRVADLPFQNVPTVPMNSFRHLPFRFVLIFSFVSFPTVSNNSIGFVLWFGLVWLGFVEEEGNTSMSEEKKSIEDCSQQVLRVQH